MYEGRINNPFLDKLFTQGYTYPASIHFEVANKLYSIARNHRPKTIVEIGSYIGLSAICFAQALIDNEQDDGIVYSIDTFSRKINLNTKDNPETINQLDLAERNRKNARMEDLIVFIKGLSENVSNDLLQKISNIDLLFIDGDHTYYGVLNDYNNYHSKVRESGFIIFHDISLTRVNAWGPRIIVDWLKSNKNYCVEEIDTSDGTGLAICQKLTNGEVRINNNIFIDAYRKGRFLYNAGFTLGQIYNYLKKGGKLSDFFTRA